jgi:hypothetical protein
LDKTFEAGIAEDLPFTDSLTHRENMADITMCTTEDCPLAKCCYRKTADPYKNQSSAEFTVEYCIDTDTQEEPFARCEYFIHN